MAGATVFVGLVTSPTEWELVAGLLVAVALLAAVSLAVAWLARRTFFPASPQRKKFFWIVAASAMTAGTAAIAVPFYLFIA